MVEWMDGWMNGVPDMDDGCVDKRGGGRDIYLQYHMIIPLKNCSELGT